MPKRRLWLCLPPVLSALGDCLATVWGQSPHYWVGDYDAANEGNPIVLWFMTLHPAALFILTVFWIACICLVILKTPRIVALMVSLCVTIGHVHCTGTWLFWHPFGIYYALSLCISSGIVFVVALELSREDART